MTFDKAPILSAIVIEQIAHGLEFYLYFTSTLNETCLHRHFGALVQMKTAHNCNGLNQESFGLCVI